MKYTYYNAEVKAAIINHCINELRAPIEQIEKFIQLIDDTYKWSRLEKVKLVHKSVNFYFFLPRHMMGEQRMYHSILGHDNEFNNEIRGRWLHIWKDPGSIATNLNR